MDKTALVSSDIELGLEVIRALDASDIKPRVALWAVLPEYEDWRLVIAAPKLDSLDLTKAYRAVNHSLSARGIGVERTPTIVIRRLTDSFIKALRGTFGKAKKVEGMRLGGQSIGDRFIEDAYVYRIS